MADLDVVEPITLPNWLTDTPLGEGAIERYERALARPSHRERWKYTRVKKITGLRSLPAIRPDLSGHEQAGIVVTENPDHLDLADLVSIQRAPEAFAQLCTQPLLHIAVSADLSQPLHLSYRGSSWPVIIDAAPNVKLTLTEAYESDQAQQ